MLFTPIYIAMTFIKTWRIRSFRARLSEYLSGNASVAFCKVPENAAETPTLSSKLCTNPRNAYLCDVLDYTNATLVCSMRPHQTIEITDWVSCGGGLPLGSEEPPPLADCDVEILLECEMDPQNSGSHQLVTTLESMGQPIAWKAGTHLAVVLRTNIENLSMIGFNFVGSEFLIDHQLPVVRIQTVRLSGEPNKAVDPSMRNLRTELQQALRQSPRDFQWPLHAALLRKLSKVVDVKSGVRGAQIEMNGTGDSLAAPARRPVSLADVSCNTGKSLNADDETRPEEVLTISIEPSKALLEKSPERRKLSDDKKIVLENVTVEIQHNITPKKASLRLDLKKGATQVSGSQMNISSQIKSVTTHKRIVCSTGPKNVSTQPSIESESNHTKEESEGQNASPSQQEIQKTWKKIHPLVNTKSLIVVIYSDSIAARDNLEASLRRVLDSDSYTLSSVSREALLDGAWRGRAALVAVAGDVGRGAPLLLAHLLSGGRLLALCSDLLHTVLPHYKTAEIRENEVVQFTFDKWKSVKMKHHIFCYQASPAKKQFSTESDKLQRATETSRYVGHPGHELAVQVLATEETWRTPSLLQATDLTNGGVAIFSQIHLEADPGEYLGAEEGVRSNEARLEIVRKVLGDLLGLHVHGHEQHAGEHARYTAGYFLGDHVHKVSLIERWCGGGRRVQRLGPLAVHWLLRGEPPAGAPTATYLPVSVVQCPEHFDTVEYFENLTSKALGRLLVYADVMASTTAVTAHPLAHGVGAAARRQGDGPPGAAPHGHAAIALQVWQRAPPSLPLLRLAAALAAVRAVRAQPAYEHLDIRIKWPNAIYHGREVKIGSVTATAQCNGDDVILNIGAGVMICSRGGSPCVNDIIADHNRLHGTSLAPLSVERFLARFCSHLEVILDCEGGEHACLGNSHEHWLHGCEMLVQTREGAAPVAGRVEGVDPSGWLLVATDEGPVRLRPGGGLDAPPEPGERT